MCMPSSPCMLVTPTHDFPRTSAKERRAHPKPHMHGRMRSVSVGKWDLVFVAVATPVLSIHGTHYTSKYRYARPCSRTIEENNSSGGVP